MSGTMTRPRWSFSCKGRLSVASKRGRSARRNSVNVAQEEPDGLHRLNGRSSRLRLHAHVGNQRLGSSLGLAAHLLFFGSAGDEPHLLSCSSSCLPAPPHHPCSGCGGRTECRSTAISLTTVLIAAVNLTPRRRHWAWGGPSQTGRKRPGLPRSAFLGFPPARRWLHSVGRLGRPRRDHRHRAAESASSTRRASRGCCRSFADPLVPLGPSFSGFGWNRVQRRLDAGGHLVLRRRGGQHHRRRGGGRVPPGKNVSRPLRDGLFFLCPRPRQPACSAGLSRYTAGADVMTPQALVLTSECWGGSSSFGATWFLETVLKLDDPLGATPGPRLRRRLRHARDSLLCRRKTPCLQTANRMAQFLVQPSGGRARLRLGLQWLSMGRAQGIRPWRCGAFPRRRGAGCG